MQRLWTPWRLAYVTGGTVGDGCVFCRAASSDDPLVVHRGEKIELRGFGSFRLRQREPRKGRNPKTGDKVDVPPKKVPYFKPGKELKDLLNRDADGLDAAAEDGGRPDGQPGPSTPDASS